MVDHIKRIIGWRSVNSINNRSKSIANVFVQTATDLADVNSKIDSEVEKRAEAAAKLEIEKNRLDEIKATNQKIIGKINSFIE